MDKNSDLMPVGFVGHGAPTLGLEKKGPAIEAWRTWARSIPKPKAILMVSAHWLERPVHIGPTRKAELIYDFYGFPDELYQVKYSAPPAPELGEEVFALLSQAGLKPIESPSRGLDHGAWVPLVHMFPKADIPVLQVSMGTRVPMAEHIALGKILSPLRSEGVFILGSGNITHNLRIVNFGDRYGKPEAWALEFDGWAREKLENFDLDALIPIRHRKPPPPGQPIQRMTITPLCWRPRPPRA